MNLALNTSFVYAPQGGWTLSNAASASAAERFCFLFYFNNFRPEHTIEAADTQKSSVRCTWKESSHRQGFDSLSPNNRQTGSESHPNPWIRQNKKIRFKGCLCLETSLFLSVFLSFSGSSLPTTCFGRCLKCLTVIVPTDVLHDLKSREQWTTVDAISSPSEPGFVSTQSSLKSEAHRFHREPFGISPFEIPTVFLI